MASHFYTYTRAAFTLPHKLKYHQLTLAVEPPGNSKLLTRGNARGKRISLAARVSDGGGGGGSYLDMWKKAVDRERKAIEFQKIAENVVADEENPEELEKKSSEFQKLLEVDREERDRVQRMQVIDRAAAAIAAARALLKETPPVKQVVDADDLASLETGDFKPQGGN